MPGWRTVPSSTVTMASARWRASPDLTSCRSPAPATSSTATWPTKRPSARSPRPCWGPRSARWRSPTTGRMVSARPFPRLALMWLLLLHLRLIFRPRCSLIITSCSFRHNSWYGKKKKLLKWISLIFSFYDSKKIHHNQNFEKKTAKQTIWWV